MSSSINSKVIILAGGKGTRFNPFSFVIPKPLMPLNQNPIILYLITQFTLNILNKIQIQIQIQI